jgi:RNA polymerase sigma factor (sigma-70 family)
MTKRCKDFDAALVPYLSALRRRAKGLTRSAADAADLFQDTLERALRASPTFRRESNLLAWLMTIMQRRAIDLTRMGRPWRRAVSTDLYEIPTPAVYSPVPWENIGERQLRRAMSCLPERLRVTLALRVIDRLPCRNIAQHLGIPVCTVHTRLLRARLKLRTLLLQPQRLREWSRAGKTLGQAGVVADPAVSARALRVAKNAARG